MPRPALVALVFVGGGLGSVARYLAGAAIQKALGGGFPAGTLAVNLVGCLAIGVVGALGLERAGLSPEARVFLMAGVLGGFTTFSSFAFETEGLLRARDAALAAVYVLSSVAFGVAGAFLGRLLGRAM